MPETPSHHGGNADAMTFWDHLETLRWALIRVIAAWGVLFVGGFALMPWLFDNVVMAPASGDFCLYRWLAHFAGTFSAVPGELTQPFHVDIINIRLASQFFLQMELAMWFAFLVAFPYAVYEAWRFVCPALYQSEKRGIRFTFVFGTLMFFAGCAVGYVLVFPLTLRFLYNYRLSGLIDNQLSLDSYMSNFLMLTSMMGIVFELPLVSLFLSRLGVLRRSFFSAYRRHAIVAILVVAAFITPSADPFTLFAVFLPIYLLWEGSAILVRK